MQSCCFGYKTYCFFDVLVAVAIALLKLPTNVICTKCPIPSYYRPVILMTCCLQVLEETGFDMSCFADPDAYLEHNFQDHQVRTKVLTW